MEQLQELVRQVERQKKLHLMETSLNDQIRTLEKKTWNLKYTWSEERDDVEKLSRFSLSGLFYDLIGKKEERLEQEQLQALAAAAKYQTAVAELEGIRRELDAVRTELQQLHGCEWQLEEAKNARAEELKAGKSETGSRIAALEEEEASLLSQKRELQEARNAGETALQMARDVETELRKAASWGTWDLISDGGLISSLAKHNHLDNAQEQINALQYQLRLFHTELSDVQMSANVKIEISEFLRFADWFFDGLIVDWTILDRIRDAQDQMYRTVCRIQQLLDRLENMESGLDCRADQVKSERDGLILRQ